MSLGKVFQKRVDYYTLEMRRTSRRPCGLRWPADHLQYAPWPADELAPQADLWQPGNAKPNQTAIQVVHILKGGAVDSPAEIVSPGVLSAAFGSSDRQQPTAWNKIPAGPRPTPGAGAMDRFGQQSAHRRSSSTASGSSILAAGWCHAEQLRQNGLARPTHPELLDWLAVWFIDHGWSIKKLHRLIMTSQTFRQSSEHADFERLTQLDARNELLAYYPVRRLAAEEIRDAMLAISGELNPRVGGPPVFPEINWEVALQPRHIMGSVAPAYQPSPRAKTAIGERCMPFIAVR